MKGRNCLLFIIIAELIILIGLSGYRIYEAVDKVVDDNEINNNENVGNEQDNKENNYYTISFDSNGGYEIEDIKVKHGTKVKLPITDLYGYDFDGWLYQNEKIDDNYIITKNMSLKASWLEEKNNNNNKAMLEYNFDKIEEFVDNENSIKLLYDFEKNIKARYSDNNIIIETLLDDEENSYLKINNKTVEIVIPSYINAVRVFKFNESYIIEYSSPGAQCNYELAVILNDIGEIIGTIGFEKISPNISTIVKSSAVLSISYDKEKNQIMIHSSNFCGTMVGIYESLDEIYKINKNDLSLVETNYYDNKIFVYESYNNSHEISNYELDNNIVHTYQCESNNCKGFDISDGNILLYDNGYYLYNYKNDTKKLIASKEISGSLNYMLDKSNAIFSTKNIIFYNKDEEMYYVYDENGNFITKMNNEPYKFTIDDKTYYFTDTFISKEKGNTVEIYNSKFKKLWDITGLSKQYKNLSGPGTAITPGLLDKNRIINSNNTITFNAEIDGIYVVFDSNMKLIHESKIYEMVDIVRDYIVVIDKNKLKILDLNEFVVAEFDYLPNAYKFDNVNINQSSGNIVISAHDYENDKNIYYYYNLNTSEKRIEK